MKKITAILLCVVLSVINLCSCQEADKEIIEDSETKISVVATIFPQYDFARQIGGDNIELKMLLSPGTESHSYDPTPQDIIAIQSCDLFIYVGGESDEWVEEILNSGDSQPKKVIALTDCVDIVQEKIVEGMETDYDDDSDEIEYDEHVWTSPVNAITISKKISETLCELDPDNESIYEQNTVDYCTKLSLLDSKFRSIVENGSRNIIIFGDRFPFRYFADEYGLKYYAAFPGCSSETEPSAKTISFLIDKVNDEEIPVVFTVELSNGKAADTICESTGAEKLEFNSCHNVTQEQFDNGITYIDIMNQNAENLKEALS